MTTDLKSFCTINLEISKTPLQRLQYLEQELFEELFYYLTYLSIIIFMTKFISTNYHQTIAYNKFKGKKQELFF